MRNQISSGGIQQQKDLTPNSSGDDSRLNSSTRRRRTLASSLLRWLGLAAAILFGYGEAGAQVITRVSAPGKFYVDDKASIGILYNYAAYVISNNTAVTIPSVYASITNIN